MCFYGVVPALVKDPTNPTPSEQKIIRSLRVFQAAMLKTPSLAGAKVDVVVIPATADGSPEDKSKEGGSEELIIGVATWLPPNVTLDFNFITTLRGGALKVAFAWGLTSVKRLLGDYTAAVERTLTKEFKARHLDRLDSWHLFEIAIEPSYQGSGYSTMLFQEAFRRAPPKPLHVVASKPANKDIYAHFGFEAQTHMVGVGEVDAAGLKARGQAATGLPEFVMIKWP
ncbi:hypothetical protein GSI_05457 [Ganoderma sinense ZZ0214-1]|uniref:Uncharacterized protein n=1 Tax=Ganoderma sinense ZZ0214-1 TaxID=1077348 RepID=A0A2G8SEK9_9APHY|nr:hypothetical protein GSI_05457 [Ganoderma sinense ZZ0214-1]